MPDNIRFKSNVPQMLALSDPTGELDDSSQVSYPTTCGRLLTVSYQTAVKLNGLDLKPGEQFGICKDADERGITSWRVWLAPQSERQRAADETAPPSELEKQLGASLELVKEPRRKPVTPQKSFEWDRRGTGTHGPAPMPAIAAEKAPARPAREAPIPFNVAFREVTQFVTAELKGIGEQWDDDSKQGMVSTILIAAAKAGYVGRWERGE